MKGRTLSFVLMFCLLISMTPVAFRAVGEIEISTADELVKIGVDPSYPLDGNYVLTADIDLKDRTWYPIGNPTGSQTEPFTGTFDGNGHKISNMMSGYTTEAQAHDDDGWGLFAYLNGATVQNLVLEGVWFNVYANYDPDDGDPAGYNGVGAVAGYINGGALIENVSVISSMVSDLGSRQSRVGGIVGSVTGSGGTVRNCLFNGVVSGSFRYYGDLGSYNNQCSVAGIVGSAVGNCTVENCLVVGTVSLNSGYGYAHPIAGYYMDRTTGADLKNCYYYAAMDLDPYGSAGKDNGGCSEVSEEDLFSGSFDKLGGSWSVSDNHMPYPSSAPVSLCSTSLDQVESLLTFEGYYASNFTTAEELLSFAERVLVGEFDLSWSEAFTMIKAGSGAGEITGSIRVSQGESSVDVPVKLTIPPLPEMTYEFSSKVRGCAYGTVSVKSLPKTGQTCYLRWGTPEGPSGDYTPLVMFNANGKKMTKVIKDKTVIPVGVTHLWLCVGDTSVISLAIPASRLLSAQTPEYTFGVMSDLHLDGENNVKAVDAILRKYTEDDVLFAVSLGDNTSNNTVAQLANWKKLQMKYSSLTVYSTLGNHDILPRHTEGGIKDFPESEYRSLVSASFDRFRSYFENTEDYDYIVEQGDDLIIFLGLGKADDVSEAGTKGGQALGQAQLDWLNETLDQYYNIDKKTGHVFLMFHYYTRGTIDTVTTASALQEQSSKKLEAVLAKYPGVIYFSGHNHYSFDVGMNIYTMRPGYTLIHTPSASTSARYKDTGHNMGREAYYVEVYQDYVLVKGYSFLRDEWQSSAMFIVSAGDSLTLSQGDEEVSVGGSKGEMSAPVSTDPEVSDTVSAQLSPGLSSGRTVWIVMVAVVSVLIAGAVVWIFLKRKNSSAKKED